MLNPAKIHKIAKLAAEKNFISEAMLKRIESKEENIKILNLANQLEKQLSECIMQKAKKGKMEFAISSLVYVSIDGLSQKVIADMLVLVEHCIRRAKRDLDKHYSVFDYPNIFQEMISEESITESNNMQQAVVPTFAIFEALIRFKKGGFDVYTNIGGVQKPDIFIGWQNINFKLDSGSNYNPVDFANIKIAELTTEISVLKNIDRLQSNYESLLKENRSLKKTLDTLLSQVPSSNDSNGDRKDDFNGNNNS